MPKVSVIMSVKNGLPYLAESIQSVLDQSHRDFEFIIIDDGSTDGTADEVRKFKDKRLRLIVQENTGVATAKNRAIAESTGKYIAIIDADDIWLPEKLSKQVAFLENYPEYVLAGCYVQIIDKDGEYLYTEKKPISHSENLRFNDVKNTWTHSAVLFSRKAFDAVGGYFEPVKQYLVDYLLLYQMAWEGKVYQLPQVLVRYRVVPSALSSKLDSPEFKALTKRSLEAGTVSEADQQLLKQVKSRESQNPAFKESMYHLHLGRSYLFHNYKPALSKKHLRQALKLNPGLHVARYYLLMVHLLPQKAIQYIYEKLSPNAGFTYVEK